MKRQAYLRDENLLTLLSLHDFIIPEIQREYVWGSDDNVEFVLKPFLISVKENAKIDEHCHYAIGLDNLHIGFLYSYKPQYIKDISQRISDEYIIDGQQRFTSLFLLLLYRAVVENRIIDFNNLIRWEDGTIAFDYKVRQLTHRFIFDLIAHVQKDGENILENIVNGNYPHWLMNDYLNDTTANNIIGALKCIHEVFNCNDDYYYDFLLTRVHFWHFKTDVTSQGEELYITMNSRGEELSKNEVQKARKLKSADQHVWGPQWEEWQTFFWRNRKQGGAKNIDADKGFNNLLSCIEAMGKSFRFNYDKVEDVSKAVEALKYIVKTDWESKLKQNYSEYYTNWIAPFKTDIWARINTTTAKWEIEKDSDTIQQENAVLLWPLLYYYFKDDNIKHNWMSFVRLMHVCYLNYHSKKTNYRYIKDFVDNLTSTGCDMLALSSIQNDNFLSEENKTLADIISVSAKPEQVESLIWEIQDKPYFLDGEDVGGDTIIDYVKSIQTIGLSCEEGIKNLISNYVVLFPEQDNEKNTILLKRALLHFQTTGNQLFWKQTSPYKDRNYETSLWKRIVRDETFILLYSDLSGGYKKQFSLNDIEVLLSDKLKSFFEEKSNRDFTTAKWSDRRLAILFDTATDGNLWKDPFLTDLGFCEDPNFIGKPFIGNTKIGNRKCGRKYQWKFINLPDNWEWHLQRLYPYWSFKFD